MKIKVKVFSRYREILGFSDIEIALEQEAINLQDAIGELEAHDNAWREVVESKGLRVAVNHEVVADVCDIVLKDGDELAFFPPVTGG